MKWEFNTKINEKMQEILEEAGKVREEIRIISEYQKEFLSIHSKFNQFYGKKYGINQRKVNRRMERNELERMMHLIRAEDSQPQKTGFLGFGGLKKDSYYVFTDKLNLVESNLSFLIEDWNNYLDSKVNELKKQLDAYEISYRKEKKEYEDINILNVYEQIETNKIKQLLLGEVAMEVPQKEYLTQVFQNHKYSFFDGKCINLSMKMSLEKLFPCYIQYEEEEQLEEIHTWIRNLYKQMLCGVSAFHCELLYLDGLYNASGLKEFLTLQNIHEEYVSDIEPKLCANGLKLLQVKRDSESIRQELLNLERYMGTVTDMLQNCNSFAIYNAKHDEKIPYRFVVLEGIDKYIDTTLIKKLLKNASACGIFVIYLQDSKLLENNDTRVKREYFEIQDLFADFPQILWKKNHIILKQDTEEYPCYLLTDAIQQTAFVNDVLTKLSVKKEVNNKFELYFPENYQWGKYTSTVKLPNGNLEGKITIPYAVDRRGKLVSIELGSADFAHGLISGGTGSGKSTMLHMIINSVVINYHPQDVQIWLADYKQTELSVYITKRPPHIKFIGIERNEEFSFSFLDFIFHEYERRSRMFVENGVRNIDSYKEKFGIHSLPRILVIIDEFHLMSQQVHENPTYAEKLENILSEARAAGIVCLFADQAVSVGLKGLTEKGKKQMRQRLAMANDKEEMSVTLDIKVTEKDTVLKTGEVLKKKWITKMNEEGIQVRETALEMQKVLLISDACREYVAEKAIHLYGSGNIPIIVDGKKQAKIDWVAAENYEKRIGDGRETFYLHLGKPSNFDPCYTIPLTRDYGQNMICIHDRYDLQKLLLLNSIKSFIRSEKSKVYILADENDSLYLNARKDLQELAHKYPNIRIASNMEAVCENILKLNEAMVERRKKISKEADLVLWLGLDSMLREFQYYDKLPEKKEKTNFSYNTQINKMQSELDQKMAGLFGTNLFETNQNKVVEETESVLFDATEKVIELVQEGAKRGLFQFVFMSNVLALKTQRLLKLEYFVYKMSGYLDRDNSIEFYGNSRFMNSMSEKKDNISFVCYDGRKARFFVPYINE